jgi:hypothetical protein
MSNRNSNNTKRTTRNTNTRTDRSTSTPSRNTRRDVYDSSQGIYRSERKLKRIGMGIRRGDTRHGDYSNVVVWKWSDGKEKSQRFVMTLAEARAFKSFLDRELTTLAR